MSRLSEKVRKLKRAIEVKKFQEINGDDKKQKPNKVHTISIPVPPELNVYGLSKVKLVLEFTQRK